MGLFTGHLQSLKEASRPHLQCTGWAKNWASTFQAHRVCVYLTYGELLAEVCQWLIAGGRSHLLEERLARDLGHVTQEGPRHVLHLRLSSAGDREHLRMRGL